MSISRPHASSFAWPRAALMGFVAAGASLVVTGARAQGPSWIVDVSTSGGSLTADAARPVIEAARGEIGECTDGPGPHRFEYVVSLRANGTVREASYDRGATSDPRAARCIRHALLELHFPAHADAATLALTLRAGDFEPSPPATSDAPPPVTSAPPPSAPPPSAPPPSALPPSAPPPSTTAPVTSAPTTSIPVARPSPSTSADVNVGVPMAVGGHTSEALLSAITQHRASLVQCYGAARATDPTLAGDATLHVTIGADGRVTSALFQAPEALASALAGCVGTAARSWTFAATSSEARITLPLTFGTPSAPVRAPTRR